MKRICMVVSELFHFGGAERVAVNLANCFCENYEIFFITVKKENQSVIYRLNPKIKIFYIAYKKKRLRYCYISSCKKMNRILKELSPDITLLINVSSYIFLPAFWKVKTKCIACEHTNLKNKYSTSSVISKIERLYAVLKCSRVVTLTQTDRKNYIRKYHLSDNKVVSIYNWIEPEIFKYYKVRDRQAKKIISVGRLSPVKGYEMLVEVANKVLHIHTDWVWHIYGSGDTEYKEKIEHMIKMYDLENRLLIKEPTNTIYKKYSEYSFLVLASYYEGLPMVLLEAKACGLPIVSFASPTGPDEIIVDESDGYLVPCYDLNAMAERMDILMREPKRIEGFSRNSHNNIDKFDREKILKQWEVLFEDLLKEEKF